MKTQSLVLLGSFFLAAGCMKNTATDSTDSAESVVDSSDSTEAEGNMMMSAVDGSDSTSLAAPTSAAVAVTIAANVATRWQPAGCASVTTNGADVTITYSDCTGPRGLVHVTGTLDLAVTVSLAGISVHGTSTGLMVNKATLDIDTDATYAVSGTTHTLTVKTDGDGTGPRGNPVEHDGNYTITWDTGSTCGSISGDWSTELGSATRSNTVDLMRCAGSCPSGTIEHKFLAGASLTLTFDGSAVATWTSSAGTSGTVALICSPAP